MFARSCPRMGVRFASGNVFYMNQTFSARHLQCVSSPLSTGFISPARFMGTSVTAAGCSGLLPLGGGGDLVQCEATELAHGNGLQLDVPVDAISPPTFPHSVLSMSWCAQSISGLQNLLNIESMKQHVGV